MAELVLDRAAQAIVKRALLAHRDNALRMGVATLFQETLAILREVDLMRFDTPTPTPPPSSIGRWAACGDKPDPPPPVVVRDQNVDLAPFCFHLDTKTVKRLVPRLPPAPTFADVQRILQELEREEKDPDWEKTRASGENPFDRPAWATSWSSHNRRWE